MKAAWFFKTFRARFPSLDVPFPESRGSQIGKPNSRKSALIDASVSSAIARSAGDNLVYHLRTCWRKPTFTKVKFASITSYDQFSLYDYLLL